MIYLTQTKKAPIAAGLSWTWIRWTDTQPRVFSIVLSERYLVKVTLFVWDDAQWPTRDKLPLEFSCATPQRISPECESCITN